MTQKSKIEANFSKAANFYEEFAVIQKEIASKLVKLAKKYLNDGDFILDLGSGTGFVGAEILKIKKAEMVACDLSLKMLKNIKGEQLRINCDFNNLPFKDNIFDAVTSSFSLQWSRDLNKIIKDCAKISKENSIIIIAIPLQGSLQEFNKAGINSINEFLSNDDVNFALKNNNYSKLEYKLVKITQNFANPLQALKNIKKIGANLSFDNKNNINNLYNYRKISNFRVNWEVGLFIYKKN